MRKLLLAAAATILAAQAHAAISYTTIDNPGDPTFNQLLGINDKGVISGYFGSGNAGHPNIGYTIAPPYTSFQPDMMTGSVQTQATGINNAGVTSGFWSPTNMGLGLDTNFGFIRWPGKNGTFRYLDVNDPLVASAPVVNQVLGINKLQIGVGFYNDMNNVPHGFAYTVKTGVFSPVTVPGSTSAAATGINDRNLICGFFTSAANGNTYAFLKPLSGGKAVHFGVKGSATTQFLGVNSQGVAVGFFLDGQSVPHGVIYNPADGQWVEVNAPAGSNGTVLNGINDKDQIVGFYMDANSNTHGVLLNGATMP